MRILKAIAKFVLFILGLLFLVFCGVIFFESNPDQSGGALELIFGIFMFLVICLIIFIKPILIIYAIIKADSWVEEIEEEENIKANREEERAEELHQARLDYYRRTGNRPRLP